MRAIRATVRNGKVHLAEPIEKAVRCDAIVVLLDDDPWEGIIRDARPRPKLAEARRKAIRDFNAGRVRRIG
jgi:hypothetical protein